MYKKPDHYSEKAKNLGYPARSVFKLEEIDKKYRICKPGRSVLDIGAAPGSWSLYCLRRIPRVSSIVAVDLKSIQNKHLGGSEKVTLIQGDISDAEIQAKIQEHAPFDLVISDAAPNTSGNRTVDCGRSFSLVSAIITLFLPLLSAEGDFIAKIFQGGDEEEIIKKLRQSFKSVNRFKPKSSRDNSFESFVIAKGKISPLFSA